MKAKKDIRNLLTNRPLIGGILGAIIGLFIVYIVSYNAYSSTPASYLLLSFIVIVTTLGGIRFFL